MGKVISFFKKTFIKENMKKFFFSFIWLTVLIFVIDIVSKWVVKNSLVDEGTSVILIPNFLYVTLIYNNGASFGMGSNGEIGWKILWLMISIIMSGALIWYYVKKYKILTTAMKVALSLMIAGAVGNLIDRAFYWENVVGFSGVIDWISFSFFPPIFNIADSALVIGVIILLIILIIETFKEVREKDKRGEYDLKPQDLENKEKNENTSSEGK